VTGLRAELGHVSLARLGALARVEAALGGELSGSLRADGALPRPALSGHLDWSSPRLGNVEVGAVSADFSSGGGVLRAEGRVVAAGQDRLRARATLPWSPRADLARALESPETSLELEGSQLELALLREFAPDALQRLDGKIDLRLAVRGGTPEPTLSGELTLANGSCDVPMLAQSFGPLDARLVLDGDSVRFERFVLRGGARGTAELTGAVKLAQLRPASADLRLAIDDFPIRWQTTVQAHAFGAVTLRGPSESLVADGEVELRALRYSLAGGSDPLLGEVTVKDSSRTERPKREAPAEVSALWSGAAANVRIVLPKDGRVQGQGASLEIAGALVASKTPGGPLAVKGAIDSQHGSYRIRGKTFIVEQAHVAFVGRSDLDPDLDVRAMHRVRNVKVYAVVRGRASAPSVQLSSDPPYPQDDVLALLLFGKTRDELGQQQAGQLQSAIAGTAGAAALDSLSTRLGLDIPIDTLEVDDSQSSTGSASTTVGVGGYVTEDIFVRYGRGLGPDSESNVRVDWRFRKRWSIETSVSTKGDSSADLVWTYDY
jgi:translocation and assembly module TamB